MLKRKPAETYAIAICFSAMFGIVVSTFFLLYSVLEIVFYDVLNPETSMRIESKVDQYSMLIEQARTTEEKERYQQELEQSLKHDYPSSMQKASSMRTIARSAVFLSLCVLFFLLHWPIIKNGRSKVDA